MLLLRTLLPPTSKVLVTEEDWARAGKFWAVEGDELRTAFCRSIPIVNGPHQGTRIPRDAPLDIVLGCEEDPNAASIVYRQQVLLGIGLRFVYYQTFASTRLTSNDVAAAVAQILYSNLLERYLSHMLQSPANLIPFGEFPLSHFAHFCRAHGAPEINDLLARSLLELGERQRLIEYTEMLNWRITPLGAEFARNIPLEH